MCPLCDHMCDFWSLKITCVYSKITHIFDNYSTPIFSAFMSIWGEYWSMIFLLRFFTNLRNFALFLATLFLEMWKRRRAVHQWEWDVKDMWLEEVSQSFLVSFLKIAQNYLFLSGSSSTRILSSTWIPKAQESNYGSESNETLCYPYSIICETSNYLYCRWKSLRSHWWPKLFGLACLVSPSCHL